MQNLQDFRGWRRSNEVMPRKPKDAAPAAASDRLKVETPAMTTSSSGGGKRKGEPSIHAGDIRSFFQKPRASSSDDVMDEALMAHMDRIEAPPAVQSLADDATDEALMAHMDHMDASVSQHQRAISPQPPRPPPPPPLPTACAARAARLVARMANSISGVGRRQSRSSPHGAGGAGRSVSGSKQRRSGDQRGRGR